MKNFILLLCVSLLSQLSFAQDATEFYKNADTLYKYKDYKKAAMAYADGIRKEGPTAATGRYRSGAAAWALAAEADSAFHYLNFISKSEKTNKVLARNIEYSEDFISLYKDKRWKPAVEKINKQAEKNGYPQEEFVYGRKDGIGLTTVKISPKVKSNGKAIIYVVSGSWFSSYNGIEINTTAMEQYLKKGYTMFAVMHGSQPRYAIPDAVSDIKRAVRYIRYNAHKFGIDPDHLGITGGSAGGHLSLMVATSDDMKNPTALDPVDRVSSRVQAVAVLFPPTDFLNWGGPGLNLVSAKEILKTKRAWGAMDFKVWNDKYSLFEEVSDTSARNKIARDISPLYFVSPDDPPIFIIHGDADKTVPVQQSQAIVSRLNEMKISNRYVIKKGKDHSGTDMNPEWQEFVDWFDKYLK
jgi:acetyl esterase/lipase